MWALKRTVSFFFISKILDGGDDELSVEVPVDLETKLVPKMNTILCILDVGIAYDLVWEEEPMGLCPLLEVMVGPPHCSHGVLWNGPSVTVGGIPLVQLGDANSPDASCSKHLGDPHDAGHRGLCTSGKQVIPANDKNNAVDPTTLCSGACQGCCDLVEADLFGP